MLYREIQEDSEIDEDTVGYSETEMQCDTGR